MTITNNYVMLFVYDYFKIMIYYIEIYKINIYIIIDNSYIFHITLIIYQNGVYVCTCNMIKNRFLLF
jgi:hypothetical protein